LRKHGLVNGGIYYASRDFEAGDKTIGISTDDGDIEVHAVFLPPGHEYDKLDLPVWMSAFTFGYALTVHMAQGSQFEHLAAWPGKRLHGALLAIRASPESAAMTAGSALAPSAPDPEAGVLPPVRDTDAIADAAWFAARPQRLFHARHGDGGTWVVRRRRQADGSDVILRTFSRASVHQDTDGELSRAWFASAYPGWSPEQVAKAARKAIRRDRV
jgi:hypothetical protein